MADAHDIQSWLNGDLLRSKRFKEQYPLIGLIVGLVFLYILTGYQAVKQQHRLSDTKKEMLDAKFRYMTISAQLTNATRQSQVLEALRENGSNLKENTVPPVKIKNEELRINVRRAKKYGMALRSDLYVHCAGFCGGVGQDHLYPGRRTKRMVEGGGEASADSPSYSCHTR